MPNDKDIKLLNYSGLARLEWLELLSVTFPLIIVFPFVGFMIGGFTGFLMLSYEALKPTIAIALYYLGSTIAISFIFEFYRVRAGKVVSCDVPPEISSKLNICIAEIYGGYNRHASVRLRWNPSDTLMGAHVRGIFYPTIVISGGLYLGLLKRDPRAIGIISHEIAHIDHYDRLLPGFIGIIIVEVISIPLLFFIQSWQSGEQIEDTAIYSMIILLWKFLVLGGSCWMMMHSREYYADACAAQVTKPSNVYVSLLKQAEGLEKQRVSFFHPSIKKRIKQAELRFPSLKTRWLWRSYLVTATIVSWIQTNFPETMNDLQFMMVKSSFWVGCLIIFFELLRPIILRSKSSFRIILPGRKFVRYGIFIVGIALGTIIQTALEQNIIGPAIFFITFLIFRSLKDWSLKN